MLEIRSSLKKILSVQVLSVFLAFGITVFAGSWFMSSIVREQLKQETESQFAGVESIFLTEMREFEAILNIVSETVQAKILQGNDFETVTEYITDITNHEMNVTKARGFMNLSAFFEVFGDRGFSGIVPDFDWSTLENWDPTERLWYIAAGSSNGEIVITKPYTDISTGDMVITFVRPIFDEDGTRMAIICIDVLPERMFEASIENYISDSNYWFLFDRNLVCISHPNAELVGKSIHGVDSGIAAFAGELQRGIAVSEQTIKDSLDEPRIVSIQQLDNGWFLGVATYVDVYYKSLYTLQIFLVILGFIMACGLSVILVSILRDKNKAEENMQLFLEVTPISCFLWNKDFQVIRCNQAALKLFGTASVDDFSDSMKDFSPELQPDGTNSLEDEFRKIRRAFNGEYQRFEWMHKTASGEALPCEVYLVRIEHRKESSVAAFIVDLREQKAKEKELRILHELNEFQLVKLNMAIHANKLGLWEVVVVDNDPVHPLNTCAWSDEFRNMLGYTDTSDFPNTLESWEKCLHPDEVDMVVKNINAHYADKTGKTPFDFEYRLRKKNGEFSYYHTAGRAIRDGEGNVVRVFGALKDITETIALQQSLENERTALQTMFNTIPDIIFCKDKDLNYTRFNDSMLNFFDITAGSLIGKNDETGLGLSKEYVKENKEFEQSIINENKIEKKEELITTPDGRTRLFETNKAPIIHDGEVAGIMGIARDITERKAMEEAALAASEAKSVFLANMSHEIRTPMNSIIGFSELALDGDLSQKARDYLNNISDSAKWLLNIINDILDISKIESGKMLLEKIPFDLHDIFLHCQSIIMPKTIEKGILLYCYAEPSIGKKLYGDPVRLRQALINLLSNSVKFTNIGTVKLLASIEKTEKDNVTIQFEIKDSGIGMTAEQIDRIFAPFTQADNSVTRKFGGTGLGLTITKNIIDLMGGRLVVESAHGVGTKISFSITFDMADDNDIFIPYQKNTHVDMEKPNFSGEILVCEDNSLNQQVICDHLARVGIKVVVAQNGKEGVDIVAKRIKEKIKPFDLIFMDIHMPVMDGLEASEKLMKMDIKTPIIAMTANIMSNDIEHYRMNGMYDFVGKPFTSQELWKCLKTYLPVVSYSAMDNPSDKNEKLMQKLKKNFVNSNQNIFAEFTKAIETEDIKSAHRIAHTLKSNAGQIGERQLQMIAAAVEAALTSQGSRPEKEQLKMLENELTLVLAKLSHLLEEGGENTTTSEYLSNKQALEILETIEPLLRNKDSKCLRLIDELIAISGAEDLIQQMDDYNFKLAYKTLIELIKEKRENIN
ncbi:MAG: PAS domain S-box protein [Oscillospiraceae bacterium]|nr:PAS domain S-box protein [Oscillospiraceae bacterium]